MNEVVAELMVAYRGLAPMVAGPALVALVLAWWLTDRLRSPRFFLRLLDHPNERSLHRTPTPRTGGLAIISGIVISLLISAAALAIVRPSMAVLPKGFASGSLWIIGSMLLVFAVSFWDDRMGVSAGLRFIIQIAAAVIVVGGVGLTLSAIPIPGFSIISLGWLAGPVSAVFLVWMANLYNFMDGMDGFAGGMTVFGFGFLAYFGWQAEHPFMFLLPTLVSMSALGFLVHNFPPARIFMGDVGSITVGFLAGTLILLGIRDHLFELWVPVILFSPFILDATVTLIRRALSGKKVWHAHREHFYQRLVLSGWSHRKTVIAEYAVMVACGILAVSYQYGNDLWKSGVLVLWIILFLGLALAVRGVEKRKRTEVQPFMTASRPKHGNA
jgi:UDP-N-acetylmuramyl pentapeptide phosphotransferase/UDP-N-acetylglucosamine-1-phosphate transferase